MGRSQARNKPQKRRNRPLRTPAESPAERDESGETLDGSSADLDGSRASRDGSDEADEKPRPGRAEDAREADTGPLVCSTWNIRPEQDLERRVGQELEAARVLEKLSG